MNDFAGRWCTTFGRMDLEQSGTHVKGVYQALEGIPCQIEGQVRSDVLKFDYREPKARGTGSFRLQRYGMFSGQWREDKTGNEGVWHGYRGFDGVWDTTFGPLRLIQEPDRVVGIYELQEGGASLEGQLRSSETPAKASRLSASETPLDAAQGTTGTTQGEASRLAFRYQGPTSQGEGWFELDESQWCFHGKWRVAGARSWEPWVGQRVFPTANLKWLVVLEAHWQRVLQEENYSLGGMLREFFARVPGLEVRHRFFASEADLESWCREILCVPEPVVLVVATHGTPEGLCGHRGILRPDALTKTLRYANNVDVLHFSACYLGNGSDGGFARSLCRELPFPISGYAAYADWAASALVDFTYLDMILEHGLTPEEAAGQVKQLLPFAGDRTSRQCPYPATRFRFWPAAGGRRPSAKTLPSIPRADENRVKKPATDAPKKTAASSPARTSTEQKPKQRDKQSSAAPSPVWSFVV